MVKTTFPKTVLKNLGNCISVAALLLLGYFPANAQDFILDGNDISSCGGRFLDSGGESGNYSPNEDFVITICSDGSDPQNGSHVQLIFSGVELGSGDLLCFFDGEDTNAPALDCSWMFGDGEPFMMQASAANTSGCLTIQFSSDASGEGAGWNAQMSCVPACQRIEASLVSSSPQVMPQDTGWIDACPGQEISFTGAANFPQNNLIYEHSEATSSFLWTFGDGTTDTNLVTSHVFDEPGGYTVQLTITDQKGCTNTNFIGQRVRIATQPNFNVQTLDEAFCVGDSVELNAIINTIDTNFVVSVETTEGNFSTGGSVSETLALPDGNSEYSTSIAFNQFSPGQTLGDADNIDRICVNIEHSWMRDLQISLICPSGDSVILHEYCCKIGPEVHLGTPIDNDGFDPEPGIGAEYCWTPDATQGTWLEVANDNTNTVPFPLPPGDYSTYDPLSALEGCPLNGEWTIRVRDLWASDNGYIFSWGIEFDPSLYPDLETFQPEIVDYGWENNASIFHFDQDSIAASPQNAGLAGYNFSILDDFGCTWDTTLNFNVLPSTHPDCRDCQELIPDLNDTAICEGDAATLDATTTESLETDVTFENFQPYSFGSTTHPPSNPYGSVISVNSIFPNTMTNPQEEIVSICVNIESEFIGDVGIVLRSPDGRTLLLANDNGGNVSGGYFNTCFTPTAANSITTGNSPFSGNFQPEGNWDDLMNAIINGDWTLEVSDDFGQTDNSRLLSWSITFKSTNEITYTWTPSTGLSCTDCPDPIATPTTTTTYEIEAVDLYGCISLDTITVAVVADIPPPNVSCDQPDDQQLVFTWDPAPGADYEIRIMINGEDQGWVGPLNSGIYPITGLINRDEVTVEVRPYSGGIDIDCDVPIGTATCVFDNCNLTGVITVPPTPVSCVGSTDGTISVEGVDGDLPYRYSLDGAQSKSSGQFANLSAGDHFIIIEDVFQCIDTIHFVIDEPAPLEVDIAFDEPIECYDGSDVGLIAVAEGGNGGYAFSWEDGTVGPMVDNLVVGSYTVTVTDNKGCTAETTLEVTPPMVIDSISMNPVDCNGNNTGTATVYASGGTGNYKYLWSDPLNQVLSTAVDLPAATYSVTVTDDNGCEISGTIEVVEPDVLSVTASSVDANCKGGMDGTAMALPVGGTPPYNYNWNNGQDEQEARFLEASDYSVTVVDARGCIAQTTIKVGEPFEELSLEIAQTFQGCFGIQDNEATVMASGGTGPNYTYLWDDTNNQTGAQAINLDSIEYTVIVTDQNGCQETALIKLQDLNDISLNIIDAQPSCFGNQDGAMGVNFIEGGAGIDEFDYSYQWSNGSVGSSIDDIPGGITYTVTVTDIQGCTKIESRFLEQPSKITFDFDLTDVACNGDNTGAARVVNIQGDNINFDIEWGNGVQGNTITDLFAGSYSVTVSDNFGCASDTMVVIEQPTPLSISFEQEDNICFGDANGQVFTQVSGGIPAYTFGWSNGQVSKDLSNLQAGTYILTLTDANNCETFETVTVEEPDLLTASITPSAVTCFGGRDGEISIAPTGGTPPYRYSTDNELFNGVSRIIGLQADEYDVFVQDANGCLFLDRVNVEAPPEFLLDAGEEIQRITLGDSVQLNVETFNAVGDVEFVWSAPYEGTLSCSECRSPFTSSQYTIFYEVYAIDARGCEATDMVKLVVDKPRIVAVPTGFTPNSDNLNDRLLVHGKEGTRIKVFQIFDRWGELLYEQNEFDVNDFSVGWDGTFRGEPVNAGVYVWKLTAIYIDGAEETYQGQTTVIR